MKHVPRLLEEPSGLRDYLGRHPADESAPGVRAKAVWDRFKNDPAYVEVRDALVAVQGGLCLYCEQRLTENGVLSAFDKQVEHVRPKSVGTGQTVNWRNLALCCSGGSWRDNDPKYLDVARHFTGKKNTSCGQAKGEQLLGIAAIFNEWSDLLDDEGHTSRDPRDFPLIPRLVGVDLQGRLSADPMACRGAGIDHETLDAAINDVLNLNCERLMRARRDIAGHVREQVQRHVAESATPSEAGAKLAELASGRLPPDAHGHLCAFWTTERQYLEPWSEEWIANNRSQLEDPLATRTRGEP